MTSLTCVQARSMVSDYIDGDLPAAMARNLEAHLETCPNCPPLYASLVGTLASLRSIEDSGGVDELAARVLTALDDHPLPPEEEK
jgi:RNA polymerase sigma-70 factor, ECF subfamily